MKRLAIALVAAAIIVSGICAVRFRTSPDSQRVSPAVHQLATLPLSFEPNVGQTQPTVRFLAHHKGGTIYFTPSEIVFTIPQHAAEADAESWLQIAHRVSTTNDVLRLRFVGANASTEVSARGQLPGRTNYFLGKDRAKWRANVPTYDEIIYSGLYDDVDLAYHGRDGALKGEYRVAAGADPSRIQWRYDGAKQVSIDESGNLSIHLRGGARVAEKKPVVWQEQDGRRVFVTADYTINAEGAIGFALGPFDHTRPLIIDPALVYSTYLGGNSLDTGYGLAVDLAGNTYITGITGSTNFPVVNAHQQNSPANFNAFVAKLSADGSTLVYATYLGGNSVDVGESLTIDTGGDVYVTGYTQSTDFPVVDPFQATNGGSADAFVAKLSPDGASLLYGTYLGGSQWDRALEIALDSANNIYLTGFTGSDNFPIANAFDASKSANGDDAFVTKLNAAGNALVFSTFLGGSSVEVGEGLAIDASGNLYVCGITGSDDFPTKNAAQPVLIGTAGVLPTGDAFVTKFNADGASLAYSTYLGGIDGENAQCIAVDPAGNAYVTGLTRSQNFPVTPLAFQKTHGGGDFDAFVTKLNTDGSLGYSTFLGGSGPDMGRNLTVDLTGHAYVTGETASPNFPTANPVQAIYGGGTVEGKDAFVTELNPDGSTLAFSTFLGGSGDDYGGDIVPVGADVIYLTGFTNSNDFPSALESYQPSLAGGVDAFIVKISKSAASPTPTPTATPSATPSREKCDLPGAIVVTDPSGDQDGGPAASAYFDIQNIYFAEPYIPEFDEPDFVAVTIKVASLSVRPPNSIWRVNLTAPGGSRHFVQMRTSATGQPTYEYGHLDDQNPDGVVDGLAQTGTNSGDGTIRTYILKSEMGNAAAGQTLTGIGGFARADATVGGQTLAQVGDSAGGNGSYQLVGNYYCRPETPPIPALSATPTTGDAPLEVNFDAGASFDQDGDSIASYTFDFGDGSDAVTQPQPTITHTYTNAGTYAATVHVADERGLTSTNPAKVTLTVNPGIAATAVSRRAHGAAGNFDVDLPRTGPAGIECRSGGANGDFQIVFTFPSAVTFTRAEVSAGTGTIASAFGSPDGKVATVNLTGVSNAQTLTVTLIGVNDGAHTNNLAVRMSVLVADTTQDRQVNSADIAQTKSQSGTNVTNTNFREDLNADGAINSADIALAKTKSGTALP